MAIKKSIRILCSLLIFLMILPVFIITPLTVQAEDSIVDINIAGITKKYREAAKWLGYINDLRMSNDLSELVMDADLMELAMKHSAELSVHVGNGNLDGTSIIGGKYNVQYISIAYGQIISRSSVVNEKNSVIMSSSIKSIGVGYIVGRNSINYLTIVTSYKAANEVDPSVLTQSNVKMDMPTKCSTEYLSNLVLSPATNSNIEVGSDLPVRFLVSNKNDTEYTAYVTGDTYITTTNSAVIKVTNPNRILTLKKGYATIGVHFTYAPSIGAKAEYTVVPNSAGNLVVSPIPDQIYTGKALTPQVTVKSSNGAELQAGTHYTLTYSNNINVGQALVEVKGMGAYIGQSVTVKFNIINNESASVLTVKSDKTNMKLGESASIVATVTNGSAPIKYKFEYATSGSSAYTTLQAASTSNKATFKPSKVGSYTVRVTANDSSGITTVGNVDINVSSALNSTVKVSPSPITLGNTVNVVGSATGGVLPYSYEISVKKPGSSAYTIISAKGSTNSCSYKPTSSGTYEFRVAVTDGEGSSSYSTQVLNVTDASLVNISTISVTSIISGNSVTLTGKASGGTSPYTYKMEAKHSSSSSYSVLQDYTSTSTKTWKPGKTGTYSVRITVKDKAGKTAAKSFTLTVKDTALTNNSTLSATSINLGSSITITGKASGGTSPYTYKMEAKHSSSSSYSVLKENGSTATKTWAPAKTGTYSVRVTVKDKTGKAVSKTFTLTVRESPTLTNNSTLSATSINLGSSITMTGKASGGTSPYTYKMEAKHSSSSSYSVLQDYTSTSTKTWIPAKAGTYSVRVTVKDKTGKAVSKTFTLTVNSGLTNNSTLSATSINLGSPITMTGKASGGTSPYTYKMEAKHSSSSSYSVLKENGSTATKTWTPAKTGTYSVRITVKDKAGKTAAKSFTLTVKDATLTNNSTISSTSVNFGNSITMTGKASGGTSPYTYKFEAEHSTSSSYHVIKDFSSTATTSWQPGKTGTYTVRITVKDKAGKTTAKSFTLTVKDTALTNSSTISSTSVNFGSSVTLTGKASGGTSPYTYKFEAKHSSSSSYSVLKENGSTATKTWTPAKTGTYSVRITVKDKAGKTASKTFTLTVKTT